MDKIDEILANFVNSFCYEPLNQMFGKINQGKKLRSKLILSICGENQDSLKLCAIIEMVHLASLLHDDVIDESLIRRGNKSINAIFGNKNAIMLGDLLYSKGFSEIAKFNRDLAIIISQAVCKLSLGELQEADLSLNFNSNKNKYLEMIYNKTASLIEASAKCAAILSGQDSQKYEIYGKNLGIAFQIVDDILDISSNETELGKPAFSDFSSGKTTIPYIFLWERLNLNDKRNLESLFKKSLTQKENEWIRSKFKEFNIINLSFDYAKDFARLASKMTNSEKLKEIIQKLTDRSF